MTIFLLYLVLSVVFIAFAVPLIQKRIKPNWLYGWRTPGVVRDERLWYPVNRLTGCWMAATGLATGIVATWTFLREVHTDIAAWINLSACMVGIVGLVIHGNVLIRRLKRRLPAAEESE